MTWQELPKGSIPELKGLRRTKPIIRSKNCISVTCELIQVTNIQKMGDEGKEVSEGAKSEATFQKSQMDILLAAINGIKSQVATLEYESKTQK